MFSFVVSTDSVGLLGNPWHMRLALNLLWGESAASKIGLEIIATHRAIAVLNTHPHLSRYLAGFHSQTYLNPPLTKPLVWLTNRLIHPPCQLPRPTSDLSATPYILLHQPAYTHLDTPQLKTLIHNYPQLVVENDQNLSTAARLARQLGPKNLIIDWLHFLNETNPPANWSQLLDTLTYHAAYTFGWHVSVGLRDNLPLIPIEVLQTAGQIARAHRISIIIEHQFQYHKLLHNRPHLDRQTLHHLDRQYQHLLRGGLIGF